MNNVNVKHPNQPLYHKQLIGHQKKIHCLAFSPNSKILASGSEDFTARLWSDDWRAIHTLKGHAGPINAIAFSPDGKTIVTGSNDTTLRLWSLDGKCQKRLYGHTGPVHCLMYSPDGKYIVSGSEDKKVRIWSNDGECLHVLDGHASSIHCLDISSDSKTFITGGINEKEVILWNMDGKSQKRINVFDANNEVPVDSKSQGIFKVSFLKFWIDNQSIIVCPCTRKGDYETKFSRYSINGALLSEKHVPGSITAIALAPDKLIFAHYVYSWMRKSYTQGRTKHTSGATQSGIYVKNFANDILGKFCEANSDEQVIDGAGATCLAFSPDGKYLATGLSDNKIYCFDLPSHNIHIEPFIANSTNEISKEAGAAAPSKESPPPNGPANSGGDEPTVHGPTNVPPSDPPPAAPSNPPTTTPSNPPAEKPAAPTPKTPNNTGTSTPPKTEPNTKDPAKAPATANAEQKTEIKEEKTDRVDNDSTDNLNIIIQPSEFQVNLDRLIGPGSYGQVYEGKYQGMKVAIKQLNEGGVQHSTLNNFKKEVLINSRIRHENCVRFYGACFTPPYSIVMELMTGGSLYEVLRSDRKLQWKQRYVIALDIAHGLMHLHSQGIIHRDLKSLNVVLSDTLRAKLTDFGLGTIKQDSRSASRISSSSAAAASNMQPKVIGTTAWNAPELLLSRKPKHTPSTDMYSFGMVLWEIASRSIPFKDAISEQQVYDWVKNGEKEEIPKETPANFSKLISSLWATPAKRPTAIEAADALTKCSEQQPKFKPQMST